MTILDATNEVTNPGGWTRCDPIAIAVHHTVTDLPATASEAQERAHIRAIDSYHVGLDYGGFGYHGITFKSGRSYLCGELHGARAHVKDRNHELWGWAVVGDFSGGLPEHRQLGGLRESLLMLTAQKDVPIGGHNDYAVPGWGTACPGMLLGFDWQAFLTPGQIIPQPWPPHVVAESAIWIAARYRLGNLNQLMPHDFDICRFVLDQEPKR